MNKSSLRQIHYRLVIFILFGGINFPSVFGQHHTLSGNAYAVIIGIKQYQHPSISGLDYADKDAAAFATYLKSKAGGSVPEDQIKLFINEGATIAAIYMALDWLKEQTKKDDLVYFYFSGHGDVEIDSARIGLGYLLAYNSPPNNYRNNAIALEDLNSMANSLTINNKAKVILITDACHSGKLAGDFYKGRQLVGNQLRLVLNNEVRLTACGKDQLAAEGPEWGGGSGVFSFHLLKGLNGLADIEKDGLIKLNELNQFIDSSFTTDKILIEKKHKQHPVIDGNPYFLMAAVDTQTVRAIKSQDQPLITGINLSTGIPGFSAMGKQPIDHFFLAAKKNSLEQILDFASYKGLDPAQFSEKIVNDCIAYQDNLALKRDTATRDFMELYNQIDYVTNSGRMILDLSPTAFDELLDEFLSNQHLLFLNDNYLHGLKDQLERNKSMAKRFNEKFVQLVHEKGQEMLNAYLTGDLAELEKRQYYANSKIDYGAFLVMLDIASSIVPADHFLARLLKVQKAYLSGLIDRLNMVSALQTDSLLNTAYQHQWQALNMEPYAAYIHNELGNLDLFKRNYDSAAYHFSMAVALSPSWAIPWSNRIRMSMATGKTDDAKQAILIADSLQPNLDFVLINAGLAMEKMQNWLYAETYYQRAIALNNRHYLPYERLAAIYLHSGEYKKANDYFRIADQLKIINNAGQSLVLNEDYFKNGIAMYIPTPSFPNNKKVAVSLCMDTDFKRGQSFNDIIFALQSMETGINDFQQYIENMKNVLKLHTDAPLAHHYIGKMLFKQQQWNGAEEALKQAISNYKTDAALWAYFTEKYDKMDSASIISCLLKPYLQYQYDPLEDHYLLAAIYEKTGFLGDAINEYEIIAGIESQRILLNENNLEQNDPVSVFAEVQLSRPQFINTIQFGGLIKAALLYEKIGEYERAEKTFLRHIAFSKEQQLETFNFYERMISLFPRDYQWKKNAGIFLHKLISEEFDNRHLSEYAGIYKTLKSVNKAGHDDSELNTIEVSFPGRLSGKSYSIKMPDFEQKNVSISYQSFSMFPGIEEEMYFWMPKIDPVIKSIEYLEQSVILSGDYKAGIDILKALADLYSWAGNTNEAVKYYLQAINLQPGNASLRNRAIDNMLVNKDLPAASEQLDSLYQRGQIRNDQELQLAYYMMLSGHNKEAETVLNNYLPQNIKEKNNQHLMQARFMWFNEEPKKAISYLQQKIIENGNDKKQTSLYQYTIARLYGGIHKKNKAFASLKKAAEAGFNYTYVLENDIIWSKLRRSNKWNRLFKKQEKP